MIRIRHRYQIVFALPAALLLSALLVAGCRKDTPNGPPAPAGNDTAAVPLAITFNAVAGNAPFLLDTVMTTENSIQYKVQRLRFYVSQLELIDSSGAHVPVTLLDSAMQPATYGIALVDYSIRGSNVLRVLTKRGRYNGISMAIGVPRLAFDGSSLNHGDASTHLPPLDVDADMYWGWKPGYIFLKIEGFSFVAKQWEQFVYHIGEDKRMMNIVASGSVSVPGDSTGQLHLKANINRLFVTPAGNYLPNLAGDLADRVANSGGPADSLVINGQKSGFITIQQ
ncbi:MAG: hypothetical protein JST22_14560 [Bacteroidetes bacterium]|nr:hypothetical protein [Bacteroidota bacterium]